MAAERRIRPEREAPELGAMMARMIAALVRRATIGDLFALAELRALVDASKAGLAAGARGAHDGPAGYSWTEIAAELGVTRQAARQEFGGGSGPGGG